MPSAGDSPVEHLAPQPWMTEATPVLAALGGSGRFVGGCVRDALLGRKIGDVDIATPLLPEEVMRRLEAAGIKAVPTGLAHGTVTAVVPPRHVEITTLRRDIETYGRHARVAFTDDWAADAARRDFTMNALFLDAEGEVFDPLGGLADLRAGRVRFVGDASTRIREDVLRLLRFYRFHAHYGRGDADAAARAACRALAPLLPSLSGERVAAELLKLLRAADPVPTLRLMREDGVLAVLLPEATRLDRLAGLVALEDAADAIRRLAALLERDAAEVAERLKLSAAERDRLLALVVPGAPVDLAADEKTQRRLAYRRGIDLYRDQVLLAGAVTGAAERVRALLRLAETWRAIRFPLRGRDVTALGIPAGPEVGRLLAAIEAWWEADDFSADRPALLAELKRRVAHG
ncbi:MAG TPA: CCA tRNA nucleotidyltransferase [Stellaceae bacterium]|nr:CCA tRNA nucleotidyltransferase [Stellaceae bacterium]